MTSCSCTIKRMLGRPSLCPLVAISDMGNSRVWKTACFVSSCCNADTDKFQAQATQDPPEHHQQEVLAPFRLSCISSAVTARYNFDLVVSNTSCNFCGHQIQLAEANWRPLDMFFSCGCLERAGSHRGLLQWKRIQHDLLCIYRRFFFCPGTDSLFLFW